MKKLFVGVILLAFAMVSPNSTMAGVDISIGIALPPPVVFEAPPNLIVLPDTYDVYVVPDLYYTDMFFWNGWWWRSWEGRWYRSYYYDRGWAYYNDVPRFYFDVDPGWRAHIINHSWHGHRWNYKPIPYHQLQKNWKSWQNNRHWQRQGTWGVQRYKPQPQQQRQELRQKRQHQYQQWPEVQRHQQWMQNQQKHQPQQQHSQPRGQQNRGESQHRQSQGRGGH